MKREEFNSKLNIVRNNSNLPPDQIKKKLKEFFPEITNEEVEKIIVKVDKKRHKSIIKDSDWER